MNTVRKAQVQSPAQPVTTENHKVQWNDQDFVDAFVEQSASHGVTISPDTAMQLAQDLRSKVKQGDDLEVKGLVNEIYTGLFPTSNDNKETTAVLESLNVISSNLSNTIATLRKRAQTQEEFSEEPISHREEQELRGHGVLDDFVIPIGKDIAGNIFAAIRKNFTQALPLQKELNELEVYIADKTKIDALFEEKKAEPKNRKKLLAFRAENRIRINKIKRSLALLNQLNVIRSKMYLLNSANNYLNRTLEVRDQYRGVDGVTRYFEKVMNPFIGNLKEIIMDVRRNKIVPEVNEKTRLEREWIMRHHNTKSYQGSEVGPSMDNITMGDFVGTETYEEMTKRGIPEDKIEQGIDQLNSKPMTWRKGQAIYMLMDPPAEKTIHEDMPTLMSDTVKEWPVDLITNQPFNIEKGKFENQEKDMVHGTKQRAMTKERKLSEAANPNAHWSVLFNLSRNQKIDASGKTRAEKYLESIPENMRSNPEVVENAEKMEEDDHLNDQEIIYAALHNPNTPDWVLMKAALTGYAEKTRRIAKAILKEKRGWIPKLDPDGKLLKDQETNDYVWEKDPTWSAPHVAAAWAPLWVTSQLAASPVPMSSSQAGSSTQQSLNNVIQTVDTNIQNHQNQIQQLQVQKQNTQKQLAAIPPAAQQTTNPPTTTTSPSTQANEANNAPVDSNGTPPIDNLGIPTQPMAAEHISFRKFSMSEEFVYE